MDLNANLPRIDAGHFGMIPRSDIPRSTFITEHSYKTTFDTGYLIPFFLDEVLPADAHQGEVTVFARLQTPLFPVMDHMTLETFFFFVPARIVWPNFKKMMGERTNPSDHISYTVPQLVSPIGGFPVGSVFDYFGLPTVGQVAAGNDVTVNAMPLRAYNLIYDEWFRDQNLQNAASPPFTDGPDNIAYYFTFRRNKKPDYFTTALPWPLKGGVEVTLPLAGTAPVTGIAVNTGTAPTGGNPASALQTYGGLAAGWAAYWSTSGAGPLVRASANSAGATPQIYADLSQATGATINALRLAFQTQVLLERDARSGTRYTEILQSHFGVTPQDSRLQRPEYIGGGRTSIQTSAIPQTSSTVGSSPLGALGAAATASDRHSFTLHASEHGYIIGIVHVGADLTYQQGLHRMWTRQTRLDFYVPALAHLGEQAIRNDEIYCTGQDAQDTAVFGYQERWSEYRYRPSKITGLFRSTSAGNIDEWHLSQQFTALPVLNSTFIQDTPPLSRVLAAGALANGAQVLFDSVFRIASTRPMPMYSVPGLADRF